MKKFINMFQNWINSAAGKISLVLLLISIVLIALAWSRWPCFMGLDADNVNNVLLGLSTNLLGIIVTVSFVQSIIDKQTEKKEAQNEVKKILRHHRIMRGLIARYFMYYKCVVVPISEREKELDIMVKKDFQFQDMCDMYSQSLYTCEASFEPSIVLFYKAEENLRNYMISMIEEIDFKYNQSLLDILLEFIEKSMSSDVRGAILENLNIVSGGRKMSEIAQEYIKETSYKWVEKFRKNELKSNMMTPYVILYDMLKEERNIIFKYLENINEHISSEEENNG